MIEKSKTTDLQVIARAARILEAPDEHPGGLSPSKIAGLVDLSSSTVPRIVVALSNYDLARATDTEYRLGQNFRDSPTPVTQTSNSTYTNRDALKADLEEIRPNGGVAIDREEHPLGICVGGIAIQAADGRWYAVLSAHTRPALLRPRGPTSYGTRYILMGGQAEMNPPTS